ncbi:hypothetical protein EON65_11455 [archaeon]|nr:MAG: hypothetical protein EON65_11455 [archaeon]
MSGFYGHDESNELNRQIEEQIAEELAAALELSQQDPPPSAIDIMHNWLDNFPNGYVIEILVRNDKFVVIYFICFLFFTY